jgi:hypothetical protein
MLWMRSKSVLKKLFPISFFLPTEVKNLQPQKEIEKELDLR